MFLSIASQEAAPVSRGRSSVGCCIQMPQGFVSKMQIFAINSGFGITDLFEEDFVFKFILPLFLNVFYFAILTCVLLPIALQLLILQCF